MLKETAFRFANSALFGHVASLLQRIDIEKPNLLRVLTYHRVDEPSKKPYLDPSLISATPYSFEKHMQFIKQHYHPISVYDVIAFFKEGKTLPSQSVLITFDDGYADFKTNAWPILKRYQIPVLLFIPTAYPSHPERYLWWDRLHNAMITTTQTGIDTPIGYLSLTDADTRLQAYKSLRDYIKKQPYPEGMELVERTSHALGVPTLGDNFILDWEALRQLATDGVIMAPHTCTHPLLHRIDLESARQEVRQSYEDLIREIGQTVSVFAYPGGGYSTEVVNMLKEEKFDLAFTTLRGINNLPQANPLLLHRINVGRKKPLSLIQLQCLPSMRYLNA